MTALDLTPPAVREAQAALEKRRGELSSAQAAHRGAQREIAGARQADTKAIADALDRAQKPPARKLEAAAQKAAEAAALELDVCQERVASAQARLAAALEESAGEWLEAVEAASLEADQAALDAVAQLRQALVARNGLVGERARLRSIGDPSQRAQALAQGASPASPGTLAALTAEHGGPEDAERLLAAFEASIRETGIEATRASEQQQREERERAQERQQERDAESARMQEEDARLAEQQPGAVRLS